MESSEHLRIKVSGREPDRLLYKSFLNVVSNTFRILRKLEPAKPIDWSIEQLSFRSPMLLGIGGTDDQRDQIEDAVGLYLDLFQTLTEGRRPPLRIPPGAVRNARKMVNVLNDGVAEIELSKPGRNPVKPDLKRVQSTFKKLYLKESPDYSEVTSIEGELRTLSVDGGAKVFIYDRLTDDRIECKVSDDIFHSLFSEDNMNRRVSMSGRVLFRKDRPLNIIVHAYEFLPSAGGSTSHGPSKIDLTGGMDSAEFVRRRRDET